MIPHLPQNIQSNPFFSGGAVLMAMGGLMAYLRQLPTTIKHWIINQVSVQVEINGMDASYGWLLVWLNQQPYTKRSRRLNVQTSLDGKTIVFTPANGQYFFRYKGKAVWLSRGQDKAGKDGGSNMQQFASEDSGFARKYENFHVRVLGRKQDLVRQLVEEARDLFERHMQKEVQLYRGAYDYWSNNSGLPERPMASVILPGDTAERLVHDIEAFLKDRAWYQDRGIPYRRGYLLRGYPGTGKSSLVGALAWHFRLPLYTLNIGNASMSDERLQQLFSYLPERCILLMEDIDATSRRSAPVVETRKKKKANDDETPKSGVTLSGLLNVLDGVGAAEGRLLFMTTNHDELLDPALIRPGRVDYVVDFKKATLDQVERLYRRFYNVPESERLLLKRFADRFTMAELQGIFLEHRNAPDRALQVLAEAA